MSAALAQQGLRATSKNGHRATQEALEAQLGQNARKVVRPFRSLRVRRHDAECPSVDTPEVTQDEVNEALQDAHDIVAAMSTFLPNLGAWRLSHMRLKRAHLDPRGRTAASGRAGLTPRWRSS